MRLRSALLLVAVLAALCACSKKATQSAPSVAGEQSKAGAFLAYEHRVRIDLADNTIAARIDALHEACVSERFGACSLLQVEQSAGNYPRGEITLRIVPAGVEPMVKLAAEGGAIGTRATRADDLADAVADTAQQQQLLARQRARLEEFQARKDLAVADMLALSRELAAIEVQADAVDKTSAQQRRRIETNRLTMELTAPASASGRSRIGEAFGNLWGSFEDGVADAIEYVGYAVPFIALGLPLLLLLRWLWRKATRASR